MVEAAHHMQYMLWCGDEASRVGCGCCSVRTATMLISVLGILFSIPIILGILGLSWKNYDMIPLVFSVFEGIGCLAPILMFFGASKMDFGVSYLGYVFHTVYIYCTILFVVFIGLFYGILILPDAYVVPPYELYYIGYFVFWMVYLVFLLYINHIYFSFTKLLGLGQHIVCCHAYGYPEPQQSIPQALIRDASIAI